MENIFDLQNLKKTYFSLAIPVVLGMLVTMIYNLADTYFISATQNTDLVAGVSLCAPVFMAIMAFGNIYGQGGSSLISRLLGQNKQEDVARVSSFCFYVALFTGLLLAVLMLVFQNQLLIVLGANNQTFFFAKEYYVVIAYGAPITLLTFIHSNLLRCEGLAKESMIGSVMGTIINIILDPIFISTFNWGARGAAIATVIGYAVTDVFFLIVVLKKSHHLSVDFKKKRIPSDYIGQIAGVGITAALANLSSSVCGVLINQYLLPYGTESIAAMGIALKINMIASLLLTGFAFGGVPLFGYVYGLKNREKLKELIRFCLIFLSSISLVITVVIIFFAPQLFSIFLNEAQIVVMGAQILRLQVVGTVFVGFTLLFTVLFQAMGFVKEAFIMSISRQGVVFVVALILCSKLFGYMGVICSQAVADVISAMVGFGLYQCAINK